MLVNLSRLSYTNWSDNIQNQVKDSFDSIIDIEPPCIYVLHTSEEIEMFAKECLQNIIKENKGNNISIYLGIGCDELFKYKFIEYSKAMGYDCYDIVMYQIENGTFVKFRKY